MLELVFFLALKLLTFLCKWGFLKIQLWFLRPKSLTLVLCKNLTYLLCVINSYQRNCCPYHQDRKKVVPSVISWVLFMFLMSTVLGLHGSCCFILRLHHLHFFQCFLKVLAKFIRIMPAQPLFGYSSGYKESLLPKLGRVFLCDPSWCLVFLSKKPFRFSVNF